MDKDNSRKTAIILDKQLIIERNMWKISNSIDVYIPNYQYEWGEKN